MPLPHKPLCHLLLYSIVASILLSACPAFAAEQVIVKYKIVRESVSVDELSAFARTGELSSSLKNYLRMAKQNPRLVRTALNFETKVNLVFLDRMLNSPVGDIVLDRIGQVIRTPSNQTNRQALRAALVLSASEDNTISLMETIENYPTQEMLVDGDRLVRAYRTLTVIPKHLQDMLF